MGLSKTLIGIVSTGASDLLPEAVCEQNKRLAGTRLVIQNPPEGVFAPTRPEDVFASLNYNGVPKTLEDMEAGIVAESRRQHGRISPGHK